jgi:hypothetical protein
LTDWLEQYYGQYNALKKQIEALSMIANLGMKHGNDILFAEKEALQFFSTSS